MTETHPNVALLMSVDLKDIGTSADAFAEDVVFHFFNPHLPDFAGDYVGLAGVQEFFSKISALTGGTFEVNPVSITAVGNELVVTHTKNRMTLPTGQVETDVVVVWRFVDGRIAEVWDIPSAYSGVQLS